MKSPQIATFVSLEKMMHYKRSILDVLKDIVPNIESDQKCRLTLVEECRNQWTRNARIQNAEDMP